MERHNKVLSLIERLGRLINTEANAAGLQPVQWEALRYLERANRFSKTAAAVTAYLGLTKGTVSQTLKALEAKGLIKKQVDPQDRRSNRLILTAKAKRLLQTDPLKESAAAIKSLPASAHAALTQGLEQLLTARLDAQGRQPFGECHDCHYFIRQHAGGKPYFCGLLEVPLSASESLEICVEQLKKAG